MTPLAADHPTGLHPELLPPSFSPYRAPTEKGRVFAHPQDVVTAPDLSRDGKRAILASWASDAWAVESAPGLRHCPGLPGRTIPVDAVLDALRSLDPEEVNEAYEWPEPARRTRKAGVRWLTSRLAQTG
jgi:hypothetical protein